MDRRREVGEFTTSPSGPVRLHQAPEIEVDGKGISAQIRAETEGYVGGMAGNDPRDGIDGAVGSGRLSGFPCKAGQAGFLSDLKFQTGSASCHSACSYGRHTREGHLEPADEDNANVMLIETNIRIKIADETARPHRLSGPHRSPRVAAGCLSVGRGANAQRHRPRG